VYETLLPMRGLAAYARASGDPAAAEAARRAGQVLLERRLLYRRSNGRLIRRDWANLHYPVYWRYDVLAALKGLVEVGARAMSERAPWARGSFVVSGVASLIWGSPSAGNSSSPATPATTPPARSTTARSTDTRGYVDPATAQRNPAVLRAIARERQVCLGVYGSTVEPGRVAVGDPVLIDD
jgi:hypothetical protein